MILQVVVSQVAQAACVEVAHGARQVVAAADALEDRLAAAAHTVRRLHPIYMLFGTRTKEECFFVWRYVRQEAAVAQPQFLSLLVLLHRVCLARCAVRPLAVLARYH